MHKLACVLLLFIILFVPARAQNEINYAVHANIIYRFTKYIKWPADKKTGDFVIGIIGNSPLYDELKSYVANKTVGTQRIVLRMFSSSTSTYDCHILFISENAGKSLKRIKLATEGTSTLLVSEGNGLATKGSCINFIVVDEHLKLEINRNNIEVKDLNIASELLRLGILVP